MSRTDQCDNHRGPPFDHFEISAPLFDVPHYNCVITSHLYDLVVNFYGA